MSLRVGVVLPTREAVLTGSPGGIAYVARAAEAGGFDSVWAGDSLLARPLVDPFTALATAAAVTSRVRLGTAVLLASLRNPVLTAQSIGSLDVVSGGRLVVGVGRGFDMPETRREFAAAGVPFESRGQRTNDTIRYWKELWTHGHASLNTAYAKVGRESVEPAVEQVGGPPVWLAGQRPATFRFIARHCDGWLPYPPTADEYRHGWEAIQKAAEEHGRRPDRIEPAVMVTVTVGDQDASRTELEEYVQAFYGYPADLVSGLQALVAGSPDLVLVRLRAYWEAGARHFVLRPATLTRQVHQVELLAEAVLPVVRGWGREQPAGAL